jgi:threonine synthase
VWRFRELVDPELEDDWIVSLREGSTPLARSPAAARWAGLEHVAFKHEGQNPTGSFKDRGMTAAISRARREGVRTVACASTGNTAASLAAYAAAAELQCVVLAPEQGTALGKLSQALAHGARTLLVRGDFDAALRLVRAEARRATLALLNSVNPLRIAGQQTIVFEILQDLAWDPPDWIAFPAGNLGNCAAFGQALRAARGAGLIDRTPRLLAVQAAGAAPFQAAYERGFDELVAVRAQTVASAIRIGAPASYARAVRAIRETNGAVVAVDDDVLLEAKAVIDRAGIGCEPASAVSLAGVRALVQGGAIQRGERVVCVLTGHLLKDPETTLAWQRGTLAPHAGGPRSQPMLIEADGSALRRALEQVASGC